jgi:hypothetical protein
MKERHVFIHFKFLDKKSLKSIILFLKKCAITQRVRKWQKIVTYFLNGILFNIATVTGCILRSQYIPLI